jgi:hypothetical protein
MKKTEIKLSPDFVKRVSELYRDMEEAYDRNAKELNFFCNSCPDNCCDSFFLHHTHTEWAYLWLGLKTLDSRQQQKIQAKAAQYVIASEDALAKGVRPVIMCPLNEDGLCGLYPYRMMLCRLHGVPASLTRPDGQTLKFPGCFRCQEHIQTENPGPPLDRTRFLQRLAGLEIELLGSRRMSAPRVKLTIAQMIVKEPPILLPEIWVTP